jgi:hypothetical protein
MEPNGTVLFSDDYIETYEVDLISGFLAAIHQYMTKTIFTGELDSLDVGGLRFVFEIQEVGCDDQIIFFVILIDRTDNIAEFRPKLQEVKWIFLKQFYTQVLEGCNGDQSRFDEFHKFEREVFERKLLNFDVKLERQLLQFFHKLLAETKDVIGAALLDMNGNVKYSFIEPNLLQNILKTIEGRFHAGVKSLKMIISEEEDGLLVLVGIKQIICSILLSKKCTFQDAAKLGQSLPNLIGSILENGV